MALAGRCEKEHHDAQSFSSVGDHGLDVAVARLGQFCRQHNSDEKYQECIGLRFRSIKMIRLS